MARVSAVLNGSLTPAQIMGDISYADALRLYHQWWIDDDPKNRLASSVVLATKSAKGLFSAYG